MTQELERAGAARAIGTHLRLPPPSTPNPRSSGPGWRRRWRRLAQEGEISRRLLLGAPLLAVGFAILAFGGVYGWAYGLAYLLVFGAMGAWAAQCARGRRIATWKPTYLPLLLFTVLALAQVAGHLTAVAASTATAMLHLGAAGAAYLLVSQCYRARRDAGWIATGVAGFTAALALLAILQTLTAGNAIYWRFTYTYASPAGSFVNRNHFAGCMEMLLPIACVAAYRHRALPWHRFLPWSMPPALGVAALIATGSRGGAAAVLAEAAAGLLGWLYFRRTSWLTRTPARTTDAPDDSPDDVTTPAWLPLPPPPAPRWGPGARPAGVLGGRSAAVLSASVLAAVMVLVVGSTRLQTRLQQTNLHAPSLVQRAALNRSSLAMFRQRPLAGWGLGTWGDVYPSFARFSDGSSYAFAHNDYLQLLAETGLAGAGCALLFWMAWQGEFRSRLRAWHTAFASGGAGTPQRAVGVAAAIACVGMLVHSWVDFNLHIPANLMLFFILAALAASSGERRSE